MQMIEVNELKPHPRNKEFFDDISGDKWEDFKKSIIRRGIVEPVVVTSDLTIVSGHQRWKAAKELKILEVPCNITYYPEKDEKLNINKNDMILEDLISTNILQRGIGNCNAMKMAKCIIELERIYGVRQGSASDGSNQYIKKADRNNFAQQKTQEDLAKQLGIDQRQLQNYKKLTRLIPELQSMVEHDALKSTTAYKIWAKLSSDEQHEFFNQIGIENIKKLTQKQTINEINKIKQEKQQIEDKNKQLELSFNELSKKYSNLKKKDITKKEIVKEKIIDNTDYNKINKLKNELQQVTNEKDNIKIRLDLMEEKAEAFEQDSIEYQKIKDDITYLTNQKDELGRKIQSITDISGLVVEIDYLIKNKLAPVRYSRSLLEAKDDEIVLNNLTEIVQTVEQWCLEMRKYIPKKENYVEVIE